MPLNAYLKSARLGEADALSGTVRLDSASKSPLELVVSLNGGKLDAIATPSSIVALVPEASKRKRFDLYRTAIADSSGHAQIEGIMPGNYQVFAWNDIDENAWQDPEVLQTYEDRGQAVTVEEGSTNQVTLNAIQ